MWLLNYDNIIKRFRHIYTSSWDRPEKLISEYIKYHRGTLHILITNGQKHLKILKFDWYFQRYS